MNSGGVSTLSCWSIFSSRDKWSTIKALPIKQIDLCIDIRSQKHVECIANDVQRVLTFMANVFSLIYSANANFVVGLMWAHAVKNEKNTWEGYLNCSIVQCRFEISPDDDLLVHEVVARVECINGNLQRDRRTETVDALAFVDNWFVRTESDNFWVSFRGKAKALEISTSR
jgi:hypothetical protein